MALFTDDENPEYSSLKKYNEQIADIALPGGSDSDAVKSALGLNDLNYTLIENYIRDTFDYISSDLCSDIS